MVGSAAGEMVMPLVIGAAFDTSGPESFPWVILAATVLGTVVFVSLMKVA